jgi:polyisoprenoid-binding protein YceI
VITDQVAPETAVRTAIVQLGNPSVGRLDAENADINRKWEINRESRVYFTTKTSVQTVNFELIKVMGTWDVNLSDPSKMTAEAKAPLDMLSTGSASRDSDIRSARYLNAAMHPEVTFKATKFEGVPAQWAPGETINFNMSGTLTIKGISKEVTFDTKAIRNGAQLKLSTSSEVTFQNFGMQSPHLVVVKTENDIPLSLQIVLDAAA